MVLLAGCRSREPPPPAPPLPLRGSTPPPRPEAPPSASPDAAIAIASDGPHVGPLPEGSQPRWRYLARGPRPRGRVRWQLDLAGRDASGEPATDGRTVFVAATDAAPEPPGEGEVYAIDLRDGTVRWHVPVGGIHGEPVEWADGAVLVDTVPHCARKAADGACAQRGPGGVVGLDAATGRTAFRTAFGSDALDARWTGAAAGATAWVHDGPTGVRAVSLPGGTAGARWDLDGTVLNLAAIGGDLVATVRGPRGTRVQRRPPGQRRPRWERTLPYPTACAPVVVGPVTVLAGFSTERLAGAPRAVGWADGADLWTGTEPPHHVETCGAAEGAVFYEVQDLAVTGWSVADGHRRGHWPLPSAATTDVAALVDGVFYVGVHGRLVGVDIFDGHAAVEIPTGASRVAGVVLWDGRGAVATQDPGVVVGFE